MQLEAQTFLRLCEESKSIVFWDIEATGLRGDYDSILCISCKPYGSDPVSFTIHQPGNDRRVVREARDYLDQFDCWATFYGKGFDRPMVNTRLLKWGDDPLPSKHHIDLYYSAKAHLLTARRSQAHLLRWLETPEKKMDVGADVWVQVINPDTRAKALKTMVERCESDCEGLEGLYERIKHVIRDIKRD